MPPPNSQIRRFLCRWGPSTILNSTPMPSPINIAANNVTRGAHANDGEPCWWTVSVNAQEVMRQVAAAVQVDPLPVNTIRSTGVPTSKLWMEVGWFREGIGRRAVIDIGAGQRLSVNACNVQTNILHPAECVSIRGERGSHEGQRPFLTGPGLFLDTLLRTSIVCSCAPASFNSAVITQSILMPAFEPPRYIPMVPGALALDIYVPGAVPAGLALPGNWTEFGDPTNATPPAGNLGNIPFSGISSERTGIVDRPGSAAGVAIANPEDVPLMFTLVWHLEF